MALCSCFRPSRSRQNQRFHLRHRRLEPDKQRMGHQRMADVQFVDALDRRHRFDVVIVQAVAGIDDQALGQAKRHAIGHALEFFSHFGRRLGIGVTTGVQFDGRRTDATRRFDLPLVGIDEQRHFASRSSTGAPPPP